LRQLFLEPRSPGDGVNILQAGAPPSGTMRQGWMQSSQQTVRLITQGVCAPVEGQNVLIPAWPRPSTSPTAMSLSSLRRRAPGLQAWGGAAVSIRVRSWPPSTGPAGPDAGGAMAIATPPTTVSDALGVPSARWSIQESLSFRGGERPTQPESLYAPCGLRPPTAPRLALCHDPTGTTRHSLCDAGARRAPRPRGW
jgi:hypothetical protein